MKILWHCIFCLFLLWLFSGCKKQYVEIVNTIKLEHLSVPTTVNLESISFIDASTGFVGGQQGKIYKTTNAGSSWTDISLPVNEVVYKVLFLTTLNGYAGTSDGVFRTTNGGSTWVQTLTNVIVKDIHFVNSTIGYAIGEDPTLGIGVVNKTTDAGQIWTDQSPLWSPGMNGIHMLNKDSGFIVAKEQYLYRTGNGGNSWQAVYSWGISTKAFSEVYSFSYDEATVVGLGGYLASHTISLSDPDIQLFNYGYNINALANRNGKMVAVGEYSVMLPMDDNGQTIWESYLSPEGTTIPRIYNDVEFPSDTYFYAVGNGGTLTRFTYPQ